MIGGAPMRLICVSVPGGLSGFVGGGTVEGFKDFWLSRGSGMNAG